MKVYQLIITITVALMCVACTTELKEDVSFDTTITLNDSISFDGKIYTVKRGAPVEFQFKGDPDFITFFSGENGSNYLYRNRTTIDTSEIKSSILSFTVKNEYGSSATNAGVIKMYYADDFPGLEKNNFEEDSVLVESFSWKDLVNQDELPQAPGSKSFEVDLKPFMGKFLTLAIRYKGVDNSGAQPRVRFMNMNIINTMKNGSLTTLSASSLGFSALNMLNKWNLPDQVKTLPANFNKEYGTVTNNTSGVWNLASSTNFYVHSSGAGTDLKYTWLISSPMVINACEPDNGTKVKDITQNTHSYSYVYNKVGTYNATFLVRNTNYAHSSEKAVHVIVNVVE